MRATVAPGRSVAAIAARLIATREALGLNQADLCTQAGIARNTYNQWEKGTNRPQLDYAIRPCERFGLTLDWIYRGIPSRLPHEIALSLDGGPAEPARRVAKRGRR